MTYKNGLTRRQFAAASGAAIAAPTFISSASAQDTVTLHWFTWIAEQLEAYEAAAQRFTELNPNITIDIDQVGWDDYWTTLQTSLIAGDAPDVFTNHLSKYPEFAERGQLVDIQPLVEQDDVDLTQYEGDLADLWARDGVRYGLPKDWDTIAMAYNKEMLDAAGIDPAVFDEWTWNFDDGGTFAEIIAQLSIDESGNTGTSDSFDSENVAQYGFGMEIGDPYGQQQWSHFAASTGWTFLEAPWTPPFHFDDERLIKTLQWHADQQLVTGFAVPDEQITSLDVQTVFASGTAAIVPMGSWQINFIDENVQFEYGWGRLPSGPEGRKSMFNGLADSIWVGSEHQEEAWEWVKFLGSKEAQDIVGSFGVVFPALPSGAELAEESWAERGIDVSPFIEQAQEEDGTFLFPIADNASEYVAIVEPAMQAIALGEAKAADILPEMNEELNSIY